MPVSSSASRAPTPASTDSIKRSTSDDRYDQLVAGHLTALSHLIEHFPSTTRQCRRKLINLGVDSTKLKWSDFNVVANTPLLVTETSALYAGVLRLENKSVRALLQTFYTLVHLDRLSGISVAESGLDGKCLSF